MAKRYTRLFSLPENLYTEGAPVLIAAGALLRDNTTDTVLAQLKLKNIGEREICAVTVIIHSFDPAGRPLVEPVRHTYLDLRIKRDGEFGQKNLATLPDKIARSYTVSVTEVVFSNSTVWTNECEEWNQLPRQETLQITLVDSELVKQYDIMVGSPDSLTPDEYMDLWRCSCGEINRADELTCHHCWKKKALVFGALCSDTLREDADVRLVKEAIEAENRRKEELKEKEQKKFIQERRNREIKKTVIITLSAIIACVACTLLITKVIIPTVEYNNAIELMDNGEYESAIAAFEATDGYKDSAEKIEACETAILDEKYDAAVELMNNGEYQDAIIAFGNLGDFNGADEQIEACEIAIKDLAYENAKELMKQGNSDEALEMFTEISDYKDSNDFIKELHYQEAEELEDEDDFAHAAMVFGSLCDYKDSKERSFSLWKGIVDVTTIDASSYLTAALCPDGTVITTGYSPESLHDIENWRDITSISVGGSYIAGLHNDGTFEFTGNEHYEECYACNITAEWTNIISIAVGNGHVVGLCSDGTVIAIGDNYYGQCEVSNWTDIIAVSAGSRHTVGLKADGTVVATGDNDSGSGQCNVDSWKDVIAISAGSSNTVGLKMDGTVVAVGDLNGDYTIGSIGLNKLSDWSNIVSISAARNHVLGLCADGTVLVTGTDVSAAQCDVSDWSDIVAIAAGSYHSVGLHADGTVVSVGTNKYTDSGNEQLRDEYCGQCDVDGWTDIIVP